MAIVKVWEHDNEEYRLDAITRLKKYFPIGSRVTVVHIRSTEGASTFRVLAYCKDRKEIINVTESVARVLDCKVNNGYDYPGLVMTGYNVSRSGKLVYDLSSVLYRGSRSKKIQKNRAGYALTEDTI